MHLTSYKTVFANGILNEQRPEYPPDFLFLCKSTQMTVTVACVTDVCVRWLLTLQSDYILMLTVAQSYASFFIDPAKMSNVQIQPVSFQLCNYNYLKLVKFPILYTAKIIISGSKYQSYNNPQLDNLNRNPWGTFINDVMHRHHL